LGFCLPKQVVLPLPLMTLKVLQLWLPATIIKLNQAQRI